MNLLQEILNYFSENSGEYWQYIWEHLSLSFISLLIAIMIGVPLGYVSNKYEKIGRLFTFTTQGLRVIPSLAVLFILIPFIGVGKLPAIIALIFLGVPPILMNTRVGFEEVSSKLLETGAGIGMTDRQLMRMVQFPLAVPHILTGIKIALGEIIASATLATYIGAGGLGTLIFTGLGLFRVDLLLIGGLTVALLAFISMVLFDWLIKRSE